MKKCLLFGVVLYCALYSSAQYAPVTIPGSQLRTITSAIVAGQEYELHILLPGNYSNTHKKYPVVYLMDSQWDFPLVKSIYGQQYYDGFIPELIVVGVTWGGIKPNADSLRARDYTPTNVSYQRQSGGAEKFLQVMEKELFPFVEKNYNAASDGRVLMGCSLGGLFTLYTLFTHPDMFTGYIAASPAIGWDKEVLYKYEKLFSAQQTASSKKLYLTVGDVETGKDRFEVFSKFISSKNYSNTGIRYKVLENTGHSGTKSETYNRGLQYVFEKPHLQLSDEVLQPFTGKYETPQGMIAEIRLENHRLVLSGPGSQPLTLKAATATKFYTDSFFLNIEFTSDGKTATVNQFGGSMSWHKK
jgi:predicted alpha/beta superfamily hydrolase